MARSAPLGISAQIIQFPNSAPAPVQQRRGPGRHPKMVTQLWKYRNKKLATKPRVSPEYMRGIESGMRAAEQLNKKPDAQREAQDFVRTTERIFNAARYQLAKVTQETSRRPT